MLCASPVKAGALTVPAAVKTWLCVASAFPLNVGWLTVPVRLQAVPVKTGTLTLPAAVTGWLWLPIALPVNTGELIVPAGVPALTL